MDLIGAMRITDGVLAYSSAFFRRRGFMQLMPTILSTTTDPLGPDPDSSVIKTGEIEYLGQKLTLMQSMILHKQVAITQGIEKIFIISPNVRLEHPHRGRTGRHLFEFCQLDFEIAYGKMEDVFRLMEDYYEGLIKHIKKEYMGELQAFGRELRSPQTPFKRFTVSELMEKYGKDWETIMSKKMEQPFWVLSHKREFYDKEHPVKKGEYLNYDLIYPEGYGEGLSGAEREHEYDRIIHRIQRDGLDMRKYSAYIQHAKRGLIPTAGAGFGIERLVRYICGAKHVGDVQLFRRVPGEKVII